MPAYKVRVGASRDVYADIDVAEAINEEDANEQALKTAVRMKHELTWEDGDLDDGIDVYDTEEIS